MRMRVMTTKRTSLCSRALIFRDHDEAITWFTEKLGFTLVADDGGAALSTGQRDGPHHSVRAGQRWVLVAAPSGENAATRLPARARLR